MLKRKKMKAGEVLNILQITRRTLNNYINSGKIHPIRLNKTHYIYDDEEIYSLLGKVKNRINVTYARVSLPKQKNDLKTQSERLYNFAVSNGYTIEKQYEDIKSGMSFSERKSFMKLIDDVTKYKVKNVIIENKDRLVRFGFELVETFFKKYGTTIIVVSNSENKTYEQEITDDLISIIHYYSMKSYSNRRKLHKAEITLKETTNEE